MDSFVFNGRQDVARSYVEIPDIAGESQIDPGIDRGVHSVAGRGDGDRPDPGAQPQPSLVWGTDGMMQGMHVDPVIPATDGFADPLLG